VAGLPFSIHIILNGIGTWVRVFTFLPSFSPGLKVHWRTALVAYGSKIGSLDCITRTF
jgi:hypothetical protein